MTINCLPYLMVGLKNLTFNPHYCFSPTSFILPCMLFKCSLQPVTRHSMSEDKICMHISLYGLAERSTTLTFPAVYLSAPYRFGHFSPTDSPRPPIRAVVSDELTLASGFSLSLASHIWRCPTHNENECLWPSKSDVVAALL